MAESNIKKEIGRRINEARKAKGLTLKELGTLAGDLKQTRLTNWEQGTRAPGPEEIKQLAVALDVSPSFLMCLSDEMQTKKSKKPDHLIPLLDSRQACKVRLHANADCEPEFSEDIVFISVNSELLSELSNHAFALKMADESMIPEIRANDVLIVDPDIKPKPGDFVMALLEGDESVIIRKYKQLSASKNTPEYELIALNNDWADIHVDSNEVQARFIGCIVSLVRNFKLV
ncbi:helix-turn-helix domain-containing protein [Legionella bozemanae]|uniref:helix-turn-helix domain-containing protein n=1 Tax=Legionella bozemanae TaxID=447 RepID=UPI001040E47B|nr:S24 family peptidase [Legionella bozemanae]